MRARRCDRGGVRPAYVVMVERMMIDDASDETTKFFFTEYVKIDYLHKMASN
jgi:hypothetical protein